MAVSRFIIWQVLPVVALLLVGGISHAQSTAALQQALANRPSAPTPPRPPIFMRTVLERLKFEPQDPKDKEAIEERKAQIEESLLRAIEAAPYVFVPTEEEVKTLRAAGASDALIEALKAANANINEADASGISPLDRQLIKQLGERNVLVRAKAAQMLSRRKVKAAVPGFAVLIASDLWEAGAALPIAGAPGEYEHFLYLDASRELALYALLQLDRPAAERALLKAMDSAEPKVREWATNVLRVLSEDVTPTKDRPADPLGE